MNKISSDKKNRNIVYFTLGEKIVKKTKKGSKKKREVTPPPTPPPVKKSTHGVLTRGKSYGRAVALQLWPSTGSGRKAGSAVGAWCGRGGEGLR